MKSFINKFKFFLQLKYAKLIVPLFALLLLYHVAKHELTKLDYTLAISYLKILSYTDLIFISLIAIVAVALLTVYDFILYLYFKLPISKIDLFKISWIANTFNNMFGMAGLTGAGVRTYLYRKYEVPTDKSIYGSFLITLATGSGLGFLAFLCIVGILPVNVIINEHFLLKTILFGACIYFIFYFIIVQTNSYTKGFFQSLKRSTISLSMFFASFIEWLFAGLLFMVISSSMGINISFLYLLGLFSIAALAGLTSMIPGGLGTFDITIMIGLDILGINPELGLATLIIYRIFYFILPWLSGIMIASFMLIPKRKQMVEQAKSLWNHLCNQFINNKSLSIKQNSYSYTPATLFIVIFMTTFVLSPPLGIIKGLLFRDMFFVLSALFLTQKS